MKENGLTISIANLRKSHFIVFQGDCPVCEFSTFSSAFKKVNEIINSCVRMRLSYDLSILFCPRRFSLRSKIVYHVSFSFKI